MERPLALIVDARDEAKASMARILAAAGIEAIPAASEADAFEILKRRPVKVALVASGDGGSDPARFLKRGKSFLPTLAVIAVVPVEAGDEVHGLAREGVFGVATYPLVPERLRLVVERALAARGAIEERGAGVESPSIGLAGHEIVGGSEAIERVRDRIERLSGGTVPVLFVGEPGTGRRLAARTLHERSARAELPRIEVDCAFGDGASIEEAMFGSSPAMEHAGGRRSAGALEKARGGSVLLLEVQALPLPIQERLASALAEGAGSPSPGGGPLPEGFRVLATASPDIDERVRDGKFLETLRACLAGAVLDLPPLRNRRVDISVLARRFVEEIVRINELPPIAIAPDALALLARHPWPGNVRELRSAIEQAVLLAENGVLRGRDLPDPFWPGREDSDLDPAADRFRDAKRRVVESFEKTYLENLLDRHRGNVTAAAAAAGMLRSALQRLLRKHAIRSSEFRGGDGFEKGSDA